MISWLRALDELFFPEQELCPVCKAAPSGKLGCCATCEVSLHIDWQIREVHGYPYGTLLPYIGTARKGIHQMKYSNGYELGELFGQLLGLALREDPYFQSVSLIVPVPLHEKRLHQRGFNQAEIIAQGIQQIWKRQICTGIVRTQNTRTQSELTYPDRRINVSRAFAVMPGINFHGKRCLIVDDVITSGWTFQAIAHLITKLGGDVVGTFVARSD